MDIGTAIPYMRSMLIWVQLSPYGRLPTYRYSAPYKNREFSL